MANKNLFQNKTGSASLPATNTTNNAGGVAYSMADEEALSQMAATGTFNDTFYVSGEDQLKEIKERAERVSPEFLAKLAIDSRQSAFMKDAPALLLSILFSKNSKLTEQVFTRVIDNGKMLRNFCQIVRSGQTSRKSFGTVGKRMIRNWIENRSLIQLFNDDIGNDPSLADIIKMVHPRGESAVREAFYGYLIGKVDGSDERLPDFVKEFEKFKVVEQHNRTLPESKVDFRRFTALDLSDSEWKQIGSKMNWTATRMNLNSLLKHNCFNDPKFTKEIATKLASRTDIQKSKVLPYQLFTAYLNMESNMPSQITNALQDAMEIATENVPSYDRDIIVAVDCSGSMTCPVTGNRGSVTTKTRCNDVASLIAACILRKNQNTKVMRFDTSATELKLNPRDSVMTLAKQIGANGGGTSVSSPVQLANSKNMKADLFVIVSDNESWADVGTGYYKKTTGLMAEWNKFKKSNPKAKLVCIDLAPNTTTQATNSGDRFNIGGASDQIFEAINAFLNDKKSWVDTVKEVTL